MTRFCLQVKNEGGMDAHAHLSIVAMGVTYNSLPRGECQRKSISVNVPAHKGWHLNCYVLPAQVAYMLRITMCVMMYFIHL